MYNQEEILLEKKYPKYLTWYISTLSALMIIIVLIVFFYRFPTYKVLYGYLDNDFNLKINLEEENISFKELYIDDVKHDYQVLQISNNYVIDSLYNKYKEITIKVNLNEKDKIVNNVFKIKLKLKIETLYQKIKEKKG